MRCQKLVDRSNGRMFIATRPAAVHVAEDALGGTTDVVEEHLGELRRAVHELERAHGDPGRVHVDEERGDAPVPRSPAEPVRVRRTQRDAYCDRLVHSFWPFTTQSPSRWRGAAGQR